jgi:hypothetical protein
MTTLHLVLSGRVIQTLGQSVKKQHTGTALAGPTLSRCKMLLHASLEGYSLKYARIDYGITLRNVDVMHIYTRASGSLRISWVYVRNYQILENSRLTSSWGYL